MMQILTIKITKTKIARIIIAITTAVATTIALETTIITTMTVVTRIATKAPIIIITLTINLIHNKTTRQKKGEKGLLKNKKMIFKSITTEKINHLEIRMGRLTVLKKAICSTMEKL
jgi:hypothetical protein